MYWWPVIILWVDKSPILQKSDSQDYGHLMSSIFWCYPLTLTTKILIITFRLLWMIPSHTMENSVHCLLKAFLCQQKAVILNWHQFCSTEHVWWCLEATITGIYWTDIGTVLNFWAHTTPAASAYRQTLSIHRLKELRHRITSLQKPLQMVVVQSMKSRRWILYICTYMYI